jgi:hypothetical protein
MDGLLRKPALFNIADLPNESTITVNTFQAAVYQFAQADPENQAAFKRANDSLASQVKNGGLRILLAAAGAPFSPPPDLRQPYLSADLRVAPSPTNRIIGGSTTPTYTIPLTVVYQFCWVDRKIFTHNTFSSNTTDDDSPSTALLFAPASVTCSALDGKSYYSQSNGLFSTKYYGFSGIFNAEVPLDELGLGSKTVGSNTFVTSDKFYVYRGNYYDSSVSWDTCNEQPSLVCDHSPASPNGWNSDTYGWLADNAGTDLFLRQGGGGSGWWMGSSEYYDSPFTQVPHMVGDFHLMHRWTGGESVTVTAPVGTSTFGTW